MTIEVQKKIKRSDYYNENKDFLNYKMSCDCGGKYSKINRSTHMKTKKHKHWIEVTGQ